MDVVSTLAAAWKNLKPNNSVDNQVLSGAGGGIRARDFWALGLLRSPGYESGALTRLGYPGSPLEVLTFMRESKLLFLSLNFLYVVWFSNVDNISHFDE